jgi:hypothetical protein
MSKHSGRNLAFVLLLALSTGSVNGAFASSRGQTPGQSATSTTTTGSASDGITGTDPEPIDPDIVNIILTILNLA